MSGSIRNRNRQSGQTTVEYVLAIFLVLLLFGVIRKGLAKMEIEQSIMKPLNEDFSRAYRYGHTKAKGFDHGEPYNQGGPDLHPRIVPEVSKHNFRIFYNPGPK